MKKLVLAALVALLVGCANDATVASANISQMADNFQIERRIIFYDSLQGAYLLSIQGRCSIEPTDTKLAVTCKTSATEYKKHYLGLSDNVTYFAEQVSSQAVSAYHYKVVFKPQVILPDVELKVGK